jgi:lipopolysaccharide/colanic/teichoic acid biosynthesis glycosyltransferase
MYARYIKRSIDVTTSFVVLVVTLPISAVVAILIKIDSDGPCIFTQYRTGVKGKKFKMYKFRTMASNNDVRDINIHNQITKVGKIIRALSIDEIPQFINVIKGDMSFVGPRPWIPEYHKYMTSYQRRRVSVRPGITGLAQASGRNSLTITDKIRLDLKYVRDITFVTDAKIIGMTIVEALKRTGIEIEKVAIHHEINTLKEQRTILRKPTAAYIKKDLGLTGGSVFYSEKPSKTSKPNNKKLAK